MTQVDASWGIRSQLEPVVSVVAGISHSWALSSSPPPQHTTMDTIELSALLADTSEFLTGLDARIRKHEIRKPVGVESFDQLLKGHGVESHDAAKMWFGQTCDGFDFWWDSVDYVESPDYIEHPGPESFTLEQSLQDRAMILEDAQPSLVKASPFPMFTEGNGDTMCLLSDGTVRLHTAGNDSLESLLPVESSCDAFWRSWASVSFQHPESLYWPRAWSESLGSIDWRGDQFEKRYSRLVYE